jgi:threonine synthase
MRYTSTRDAHVDVTSAQAIARGISGEGGLFVPASIPALSLREIESLAGTDYVGRAEYVLSKFLTAEGGWARGELPEYLRKAYTGRFGAAAVAPVKQLGGNDYVLELFHGPTSAFKDMALQLLPHLLAASAEKTQDRREIVILVATSGDTGKAALEGFRDVPGTKIAVFYPSEGVSAVQKRQMATQEGGNVRVVAVRGNFDDAQNGVKAIFTDPAILAGMAAKGRAFSSANSINWGRLAPQIVYYFSAYCDLLRRGSIQPGAPVHFAVPTGNFGNILAGYYAKAMGLPVGKLICASNRNRVLTDFLETGVYSRNRPFYVTSSPSMDILISSNLERLLWLAAGRDSGLVTGWMRQLSQEGRYAIPPAMRDALRADFGAGSCDEAQTAAAIRKAWRERGYLADTHTACALHVLEAWRTRTGDTTPCVAVATASPFKFAADVLRAVTGGIAPPDEFAALAALESETGLPCPAPLAGLEGKPPRFTEVCEKGEMAGFVDF